MSELSSPYNFVPVVDEVFTPQWGEPSHDVPFSDSVSGQLHLKLTAKSPLYVRGAHPKPERTSDLLWDQPDPGPSTPFGRWTESYCDPASGKYAIPGTTLKGAIRNVLKIASFGSIGYADDDFISVRDLYDSRYRDYITKPRTVGSVMAYEAKVRGGWLSENPDPDPEAPEWIIHPCEVARVEQTTLETFGKLTRMDLGKSMSGAGSKYAAWGTPLTIQFDLASTTVHTHSGGKHLVYNKATGLGAGAKNGTLVFTGQSAPRERRDEHGVWQPANGRKHMEFIFYDEEKTALPVSRETQKKFRDTHPHDNEGWTYWRKKLGAPNGRIPVFWIENECAQLDQERIVAFGLAQMFRLPARNLLDGIPPRHKQSEGLDVSDRIFGAVRKKDSLRRRVAFSRLILDGENNTVRFGRVIKTVLGTPRPTFYPAYLEQPDYSVPDGELTGGKKSYQTWLSPEIRIRGWKRYPVTDAPTDQPESIRHVHPLPPNENGGLNYQVATAFRPVKATAEFTRSVHFHNLRRRELGALVWALTWGGDKALRHSLGMGKSLGMGSCTVDIDWAKSELVWLGDPERAMCQEKTDRQAFANGCVADFASTMSEFTENLLSPTTQRATWLDTAPMKELLAMAKPSAMNEHKTFPVLPAFKRIKDDGLTLPRMTEIVTPALPRVEHQLASGNLPLSAASSEPAAHPGGVQVAQAGWKTGAHVVCTLLTERTAKGKAKLQIKGGDESTKGCFHPQSKVPPEAADPATAKAGAEFPCRIRIIASGNYQFEWMPEGPTP